MPSKLLFFVAFIVVTAYAQTCVDPNQYPCSGDGYCTPGFYCGGPCCDGFGTSFCLPEPCVISDPSACQTQNLQLGAIIGGTIGGLIGCIILATCCRLLISRSKTTTATATPYVKHETHKPLTARTTQV
eukprot:TRINITY_DN6018_c0_g1_i4.p2 TRINITY_DN6018_c0_g1~~TRINITY_DN6018_c0_g1_i4.p2  ORF type:complete len:129 (+),score=1.17 TRINITY_DN6018_c0_g1_i4:65-451(+)